MNIKKVFASLTGVLMLATTVTPLVTGAASYGAELEGAYKYAFEKGITTMASIDSANMYGEITRGQLAKMISNWAEAELGQKADATKVCSFTDEGTAEGDLAMYLKKSCQMGLMGQGIAAFRPNAKVTRGEFGTTLSRALWGDKYNTTATPYYVNHLQALKDAGIMTRIETPAQLEIRGYVMLMLQRAVAKKDAANCADPIIALACSVGGETCPAACKKVDTTTVAPKAGDLKVTATAASNTRIIAGAVSDLDTLTFTASEDVSLSRVILERYGYSNNEVLSGVWLENAEGVRVSSIRTPNNRDEMSLVIDRDYRNMGKKASFTIVAEVKPDAVNQTIGFKVKAVESSAKNLDISSYTPFNYDVVDYKGGDVQVSLKGSDRTYQYAAGKFFEVARVQVKATNKSVKVNGFTLTNAGNLDLSRYLEKAEVTVDGKVVSSAKVTADRNGNVVVSFDNVNIESKKNATFVLSVAMKTLDRYNETVTLNLNEKSDIRAVEDKTGARVSASNANIAGKTYTFAGGQTRLTNTKLASIIDAAQGSQNVVFAEGDLSISEAVELQNVVLTQTSTALNDKAIESISIIIAGEEYTAENKNNTFTFGKVLLEKSGKVQFKANIDSEATKDATITVTMGADQLFSQTDFAGAKYYDASNQLVNVTDVIGSITLSKIKTQVARATMINNLTKEVEVKTEDTANRTVFDGTYTAQKQDVTLRHLKISEINNKRLANGEQVELTVAVNGTTVDTVTLNSNDFEKESFPTEVLVKKGEKATVKVTANVLLLAEKNLTYKVELKGEDSDGADSGIGYANTVKINAKANTSVSVSSITNTQNTLLLKSSNIDLATYTVKPYNGVEGTSVDAVKVSIEGDSIATMNPAFDSSSLILYVNGQEVAASDINVATDSNKKTLTVTNLNETLPLEGFQIKVSSRVELPVGSYDITLNEVNGKTFNRTIKKTITDALVKVVSQNDRSSTTQYILDTRGVNGDEVVTELKFMNGTRVLATKDVVSLGEDSLTITNDVDPIAIDKITYKVNNNDVELTLSNLPDYFMVNGNGLKVYAITNK